MAAAKFRLKAQGLITPVYGALASAWAGEISEQGSKKKRKEKKTSSVSEEEVCPKATARLPLPLPPTPTATTEAPHPMAEPIARHAQCVTDVGEVSAKEKETQALPQEPVKLMETPL